MYVLQSNGLESMAPELVFLLGAVILIAFVASAASSIYAQQRVANTIELGVQGIVGINAMQEVSDSSAIANDVTTDNATASADIQETVSEVESESGDDVELSDVISFLEDAAGELEDDEDGRNS